MRNRVNSHEIGVIGVGKLGLPLSAVLADAGHKVIAVDTDDKRIDALNSKGYSGPEPEVETLLRVNLENLTFSSKFSDLSDSEIVYIIVPTPSDESGLFLNDFLITALTKVAEIWKGKQSHHTVVVVSTVIPGSCENVLIPFLESELNEKLGSRINLVYSPEFIALGTVVHNLKNPDLVLVGSSDAYAAELHLEIMNSIVQSEPEIQVLSLVEAELAKLLINTYVTMKISFANFISELTDKFGGNSEIIARSIGMDTRVGNKYLKPGLGFGGPCFPRDNKALIAIGASRDLTANLAIATDQINERQPDKMLNRLRAKLDPRSQVLIVGLTYKYGSEVVEASQGIKLANAFAESGFQTNAFDFSLLKAPHLLNSSIEFLESSSQIANYDLVINTNGTPFEKLEILHDDKYLEL